MSTDNPYRIDSAVATPASNEAHGVARADTGPLAMPAVASCPQGEETDGVEVDQAGEVELDPAMVEQLVADLRSRSSLLRGAVAGVLAMAAGAAVWTGVAVATEYQIGWMAVGMGCAVGFAVRLGGRGLENSFGILGASLALMGCVLGNLLTGCYFLSSELGLDYVKVLTGINPQSAVEVLKVMFQPMDLLFYGIALYEGYEFSFRSISPEELSRVAAQQSGAAV